MLNLLDQQSYVILHSFRDPQAQPMQTDKGITGVVWTSKGWRLAVQPCLEHTVPSALAQCAALDMFDVRVAV